MDFKALKKWLNENNLTFKLEAYGGCHPDTILIYKDSRMVYEGDYEPGIDYTDAVDEVKSVLGL